MYVHASMHVQVCVCVLVCVCGGARTWSLQLDHGYESLTPVLPADALDKAGLKGSLRLSFMSGVEMISHCPHSCCFEGRRRHSSGGPLQLLPLVRTGDR